MANNTISIRFDRAAEFAVSLTMAGAAYTATHNGDWVIFTVTGY